MFDSAAVRQLETLAANAWPAAHEAALDGWRLRATAGVTRRANSVWPNGPVDPAHLADHLETVERYYAGHGLPSRYQICAAMQPADLDDILAARGYSRVAPSLVLVAPFGDLIERLPALRHFPDFELEVNEEFDDGWFALYSEAEGDAHDDQRAAVRRSILLRIAPPCGFVMLSAGGQPAAVGLGVVEQGWLGLFCVATLPAVRRRGAARAILRTLVLWSQLYDARAAYLQVMEDNLPARGLYAAAGFQVAYPYHYRELRSLPHPGAIHQA